MKVAILALLSLTLICNVAICADFLEEFENGLDDWLAVDEPANLLEDKGPSSWVTQAGPFNGKAINQTSNIWGDVGDVVGLGTFCIYDKMELKNFELTVESLANDNDGMGFVWGWKDRKDHYRFFTMIDAGNPGGAQGKEGDPGKAPWSLIEKRTSDERPYYKTLEVVREAAYQQGVAITFKLIVKDGTFKVYAGKNLIAEAKDPSYKGGKVGLTMYAQSGNFFDNFKIVDSSAAVDPKSKIATIWGAIKN